MDKPQLIPPSSIWYKQQKKLVSYGGKYSWNKTDLLQIVNELNIPMYGEPTRENVVTTLLCKMSEIEITDKKIDHLCDIRHDIIHEFAQMDRDILQNEFYTLGGKQRNILWYKFYKKHITNGNRWNLWNTASLLGLVPFDNYDFFDDDPDADGSNSDNHWMGTEAWSLLIRISHEGTFITRGSQDIDTVCPDNFLDDAERYDMFHDYRVSICGFMKREMAIRVRMEMNILGFFAFTSPIGDTSPIGRGVSIRPVPMGFAGMDSYLLANYKKEIRKDYEEMIIIDPVPYRTASSTHGLFTTLLGVIRTYRREEREKERESDAKHEAVITQRRRTSCENTEATHEL
jgi:hypothetical protein